VGVFRDAPVVDIARAIGAFLDDPVTPPPRDAA
jgi:hypothetical protein